ncbi:flagellar protein FlaG [Gammaproteobacteria bacterium]|nr:flagellar protein FlaG [Gammaproteobacteria bacterium]
MSSMDVSSTPVVKPSPTLSNPTVTPKVSTEVEINKVAEASARVAADISDQKSRSSQEIRDVQDRLEDTIRSLNIKMEVKSSHLNFSVDEISDRVMVTVTNKNTGEVVRQVPADAILKVAHNMEALKGVIFDEMF